MSVNILHHTILGNVILKIVHMDQCPLDHIRRCVGHRNLDHVPIFFYELLRIGLVVLLDHVFVNFADGKHVNEQLRDDANRSQSDANTDRSWKVAGVVLNVVEIVMSKLTSFNQEWWSFFL